MLLTKKYKEKLWGELKDRVYIKLMNELCKIFEIIKLGVIKKLIIHNDKENVKVWDKY